MDRLYDINHTKYKVAINTFLPYLLMLVFRSIYVLKRKQYPNVIVEYYIFKVVSFIIYSITVKDFVWRFNILLVYKYDLQRVMSYVGLSHLTTSSSKGLLPILTEHGWIESYHILCHAGTVFVCSTKYTSQIR